MGGALDDPEERALAQRRAELRKQRLVQVRQQERVRAQMKREEHAVKQVTQASLHHRVFSFSFVVGLGSSSMKC